MQRVHAVFTNGAFVPNEPYDLPEGTEVDLFISTEGRMEEPLAPPQDRGQIMARLIERMSSEKLSPDAPRFTRDELHDRR